MSVVIRGMEMPKNCAECPFLYDGDSCYAENRQDYLWLPICSNSTSSEWRLGQFPFDKMRVDWCPLEEIVE